MQTLPARLLKDAQQALLISGTALLLGLLFQLLTPRGPTQDTIDIKALEEIVLHPSDKYILLDTRPPDFFHTGHLPSALNLPLESFDTLYPQLKPLFKGKTLITYCASQTCPTASKATVRLQSQGHKVLVYQEGWEEWKIANKPIATASQ